MESPTTVGLPAPKSKAVQLGVLGFLGQCWDALGGLEGLWGGLPCPPTME